MRDPEPTHFPQCGHRRPPKLRAGPHRADPDQRLAWLLVVATIPVGLAGLVLEHAVRTALGKPAPAAIFLILNGIMLYVAWTAVA